MLFRSLNSVEESPLFTLLRVRVSYIRQVVHSLRDYWESIRRLQENSASQEKRTKY